MVGSSKYARKTPKTTKMIDIEESEREIKQVVKTPKGTDSTILYTANSAIMWFLVPG